MSFVAACHLGPPPVSRDGGEGEWGSVGGRQGELFKVGAAELFPSARRRLETHVLVRVRMLEKGRAHACGRRPPAQTAARGQWEECGGDERSRPEEGEERSGGGVE